MILSQVYGQSIIIALSVINTYYPQYLSYTFIIFVISMLIVSYYTVRTSLRHVIGAEAKEIRGGRKLIDVKYDEVMNIVKYDGKLNEELKPMFKTAMLSFINMFVVFAWYFIYFRLAIPYFESVADPTYKFIGFLMGYEIPYVGVTLMNLLSRKSLRTSIQVVREYAIYDRGILGSGVAIKFPLTNEYVVKVDPGRKYVELVKVSKGAVTKYRFYSKNYERIAEVISRLGKPKSEVK